MFNRYYQTGIRIGALPATGWSHGQYQTLAKTLWKGVPADVPYAVIEIARDGKKFLIGPFQAKSDASDRYGTSTGNPADWVTYVAYFDRKVPAGEDMLIDEAWFQPTDVVKVETKTERISTVIKAGFGLGAVLGLLALIAKH